MAKKDDLAGIPSAVLKQQRKAERLMEQASKADDPAPVETVNTDDPAPEPTIAPEIVTDPVVEGVPAIPTGEPTDQWKHKYDVLQGKYNAETTAFRSQIVDLQAQMDRQKVLIENMNVAAPAQAPDVTLLDPEDYQGWGDEVKLLVTQVNDLKTTVANQATQIQARPAQAAQTDDGGLATRLETLESEAETTRVSNYLNHLDVNVNGNWKDINVMPSFAAWLKEDDPISMMPRSTILTQAADALRGVQVASIFNQFISANSANGGSVVADAMPNGGGHGNFNSDAPAKAMSTNVLTKAQNDFVKGIITEAEYNQISADFQKSLRK